jgi:hypothetical protein
MRSARAESTVMSTRLGFDAAVARDTAAKKRPRKRRLVLAINLRIVKVRVMTVRVVTVRIMTVSVKADTLFANGYGQGFEGRNDVR